MHLYHHHIFIVLGQGLLPMERIECETISVEKGRSTRAGVSRQGSGHLHYLRRIFWPGGSMIRDILFHVHVRGLTGLSLKSPILQDTLFTSTFVVCQVACWRFQRTPKSAPKNEIAIVYACICKDRHTASGTGGLPGLLVKFTIAVL